MDFSGTNLENTNLLNNSHSHSSNSRQLLKKRTSLSSDGMATIHLVYTVAIVTFQVPRWRRGSTPLPGVVAILGTNISMVGTLYFVNK